MKNKLLSILIPTYNREDFISQAIDSVLNQEFEDFEIICSDNASTDRTYEILQEYTKKNSKIKVFQNEENLGPVLNWKNCLEHASGEYVHWLWSDDWIEPNFYVDAFALMKKDNTRAITTWNYRSDNANDINEKYISWQFSFPIVPGKIASKKVLLMSGELPVSPAAYILPRELVLKNFYLNIPKANNTLDPVNKGVGVDSLMVVGVCQALENLSVLRKPSVVFRKHDNLSVQLSRDGSLGKMYLISHLWFLLNNDVKLSLYDILKLLRRTLRTFRFSVFNIKIFGLIVRSAIKLILNMGKDEFENKYNSVKVKFK